MRIIVLSDVHGNILRCQDIALRNPSTPILQLGDLGVGFVPRELIENLPHNFFFFVGNHDNRKLANNFRNCIGDFGPWKGGIFFVSGADSKDKAIRTEGLNWWPDEELTYQQGEICVCRWVAGKCSIIVSHDLPQRIAESYYMIYDKSRTRQILDEMTSIRQPRLHIFGHHHRPFHQYHNGTDYVGLKIDEAIVLDISENNVTVSLL